MRGKAVSEIINKHAIEVFEEGNRGAVALTLIDPILREHEGHTVTRMVTDYRSGKLTSERCFGLIGEINALRRVRESLQGKVNLSNVVAKEEAN